MALELRRLGGRPELRRGAGGAAAPGWVVEGCGAAGRFGVAKAGNGGAR